MSAADVGRAALESAGERLRAQAAAHRRESELLLARAEALTLAALDLDTNAGVIIGTAERRVEAGR